MTGLEGALKAAREQLRGLSRRARCAQAGTRKTCVQLADLGAALESSEEEILHAASVLSSLVPTALPHCAWAWVPAIDLVTLGLPLPLGGSVSSEKWRSDWPPPLAG